MISRRRLVNALGAIALVSPFGSFAQQQGKVWRIGFLSSRGRPENLDADYILGSFARGMRELGYVEGKNLVIEWRFADNDEERLPGLAGNLVQLKPDVIVSGSAITTVALQKATSSVPIVIANVNEPVGLGFVKSLAHPGGNITGLSSTTGELAPKHLEMLRGMLPGLSRVAVLVYPPSPNQAVMLKGVEAAAQKLKIKILPVRAETAQEIVDAFALMNKEKVQALIVPQSPFSNRHVRRIAELALKNRLPTVAGVRQYVEAGGLMSYGQNVNDTFRRAAGYVDKILKGAKPADLPVEQPATFEMFINRKTAKALGLAIPQSLLVSADKVIE